MGTILAGGWLAPADMQSSALLAPLLADVGLNTACALTLAGIALLWPAIRRWLGALIAVMGAVVIAQYLLAWAPPDGPWRMLLNVAGSDLPWRGRMVPLSAFSLLCAGLALCRIDRPRSVPEQLMLQLAPGLIVVAAAGGILNRSLGGLLFLPTLEGYAVMSVATMAALFVFVAGYLAAMVGMPWFRAFYAKHEERQILAISLTAFVAAMLLGGAVVIGLLGRQTQGMLEKTLSDDAQAQAATLRETVAAALQKLQHRARRGAAQADLNAALRELAGPDGSAWVEGRGGASQPHVGKIQNQSRFRLPLKGASDIWLAWDHAWFLEERFPNPRGIGSVVVQVPLPGLQALFNDSAVGAAHVAETRLCGLTGEEGMACFPSTLMPVALRAPTTHNGQPIPMWHALKGRQNITVAPDCRGVLVIAAAVPLAEFELGLVRKVDAEVLYRPLRATAWQAIWLILGIGAVAAGLMYWRVRRVVRRAVETGGQLRGVLDVLPVGVWVADSAGRIVLNNPAGSRIWAGERWVGVEQYGEYKGWWHDTGERIEAHEWALARAIEHGETSVGETVGIECFDGSRKIISNSALPLRDERGVIAGAVVVNLDITDLMQTEAALSASRDLLQSIVENAPIRVFWKDTESRYLGCNTAFARDAGMARPHDLVGKDDYQMGWCDQARQYRADDQQVMQSGVPKIAYEEQQTTPDGRVIWLRTSKVPLCDAAGQVFGVLGINDDITESKLAVEALQRSQQSLVEAQRIGRMGSWELDLVRDNLTWSDEIFHIFELDPKQFGASYAAFLNAVHPDDRERVNEAYAESVSQRKPYDIEHRLLMQDKRVKHVIDRGETFYAADGKPLRSIGTVQDITERKQAEAKIRRLEREFHSLAENLPDIVSRFDSGLRSIYINPEMERATGMQSSMLLGKTHAELGVSAPVADIWTNALRRVLFTGEPETFEFQFPSAGGTMRYYHVRAVPEFDPAGEVATVLTIARDISMLKGAEAVLRESEERFHAITSNVPGMVFQCYRRMGGDRLQFTYVSNGVEGLLGIEPAAIQLDPDQLIERILGEHVRTFHESMARSQAQMSLWNWEGRVSTAEGGAKWINLRATPRRGGEDMCIWDGVAINVTEIKASEETLRQSQETLRELSAHLENVREEERKSIAREIHDELGQTLTALRMDVSLARLNFGESSPQLMLRLQSMTQLVDRTIEIARHVTSSLRPAALDLGIVAALEWLVETFIGHAGIPCELVLGDGKIALDESAATAVFRIVQESLTNIARHAQATQAEVIVTRTEGHLCFEVRDNGIGFDPGAATGRKSFGLVGMRERVAMLQGELVIDSQPGCGTRICACVPVA